MSGSKGPWLDEATSAEFSVSPDGVLQLSMRTKEWPDEHIIRIPAELGRSLALQIASLRRPELLRGS